MNTINIIFFLFQFPLVIIQLFVSCLSSITVLEMTNPLLIQRAFSGLLVQFPISFPLSFTLTTFQKVFFKSSLFTSFSPQLTYIKNLKSTDEFRYLWWHHNCSHTRRGDLKPIVQMSLIVPWCLSQCFVLRQCYFYQIACLHCSFFVFLSVTYRSKFLSMLTHEVRSTINYFCSLHFLLLIF